mmetsp:Transcript_46820/g.69628  ORF Transcript_46820/g.69628 Transcript_46820/m.69628 type:complete len:423 (-) Transcript_46820:145-1413(-)
MVSVASASFMKRIKSLLLVLVLSVSATDGLDNGLGLTPPMGFNTWNTFRCDINENLIFNITDKFVELGLPQVGYTYVNLDDCWMAWNRTSDGKYMADPHKFPNGMKVIGDYIHDRGLKFGVYSSAGTYTCQKRPGSLGHEAGDAQSFAEWGVDYFKYDNCYSENIPGIDRYPIMREALNATGRPIFFSLCQWGVEDSWRWAPSVGNSWRTTGDIGKNWGSISGNFWESQKHWYMSRPGAWLDPDMLQVGNGNLTHDENKAHFAMWCFAKAPLLLGNDLRSMTQEQVDIVTNTNLIAVNQDPYAKQASCFMGCDRNSAQWSVFATRLTGGDVAVLVVNWMDSTSPSLTFPAHTVGVVPTPKKQKVWVTDLWTNKVIARYDFNSSKTIPVTPMASHGCVAYRLSIVDNDPREAAAKSSLRATAE